MPVLSAERRDLAVFTIAQDEPEFVHAWVNHYKKHVAAPSDVHVLLHAPTGPDGGSIGDSEISAWRHAEALLGSHHGVTTLHVHRVLAFDHMWLEETAARFQAFLLQSSDWVLFAEIDEFILPRPNGPAATLLEFVRALGRDAPAAIRAEGFEVMQQPGEPPLSRQLYEGGTNTALTAADLLEGRSFWHVSKVLSKTLLARVPMRWEVGFHRVREGAAEISASLPSQSLTLVHLHCADFDLAFGRARRSSARKWSKPAIERGWGRQNRIDREDAMRAAWTVDGDSGKPLVASRLSPIARDIVAALR